MSTTVTYDEGSITYDESSMTYDGGYPQRPIPRYQDEWGRWVSSTPQGPAAAARTRYGHELR